ncbi:MAG TPA: serine/threonine-protein kinase, partial [Holophaga sp.]|nr:serine/threonine-protein kinase [Holophaga sp.]
MPHPQLQPKWLRPDLPREGRYVLGPLLGKGGMGEVVEAWDVVLCRAVALKSMRDLDAPAMIRFMHEAQIQARVVHPNICRIYDIETGDRALRIAMQLVKGPSLEQASRQLSINEAVAILAQVAEAVHAAHRVHLIHRDLKPSNILLERDGDGRWTPYICDFGLALSLDEPALSLGHTVLGTPAYMAPEQLEGDRDRICPATDVYALGGTLHFCLMGHPPGLLGAKGAGTQRPGLPGDLNLILDTALAPDPGRRYP